MIEGVALANIRGMKHLHGALLLAAASLLATGAYAQNPHAAPQGKANAADKAEKSGEKAADKVEKAGEKAKGEVDKAADKAKDGLKANEDHAARKAKEHDAQRAKLGAMLKAPMTDDLKQELRRHAERVAKIERIKAVAQTEKDTTTVDKSTALLTKENDRHEKWMGKLSSATAAPGTPAITPPPVTTDSKGGSK